MQTQLLMHLTTARRLPKPLITLLVMLAAHRLQHSALQLMVRLMDQQPSQAPVLAKHFSARPIMI